MHGQTALIIATDSLLQEHLLEVLGAADHDAVVVASPKAAISALRDAKFFVTLAQSHLEDQDPMDVAALLSAAHGRAGRIVLLAEKTGEPYHANGAPVLADDVLLDPFDRKRLESAIRRAASFRGDEDDPPVRVCREMALWQSPRMADVRDIIQRAADVDVTVLITGDTGTGKDVVARAIHYLSSRHQRPFVKVNCAAVPRELLESELFGHERGAFTGAHELKRGNFEAASHGTIFLDEIGDLHPALQGKLLHVLQDGAFSRVGGNSSIRVDVRVLAATNQDLEQAVAAGRFREDLYYRLNVIQIAVPPLRERREDIPLLAEYFIRRYAKAFRRERFAVPPAAMERLLRHSYPGNVRELENLIKRMIVLSDPQLSRTFVTPHGGPTPWRPLKESEPAAISLKDVSRQAARTAEREAITGMLDRTGWNRGRAAHFLGISYRALLYKMKQGGITGQRRASGAVGEGRL